MLTTQLHLAPMLRMSSAIHLLSIRLHVVEREKFTSNPPQQQSWVPKCLGWCKIVTFCQGSPSAHHIELTRLTKPSSAGWRIFGQSTRCSWRNKQHSTTNIIWFLVIVFVTNKHFVLCVTSDRYGCCCGYCHPWMYRARDAVWTLQSMPIV
jgi:hypothetical protein